MGYRVKDFTNLLETIAPLGSQESYDNSGLITGNKEQKVTGVLLSLDCLEATIDEAISLGANLIISHHPIVFKGIKKLNGKSYVERTLIKAIKNDIALYAIHTNLDNCKTGVNAEIARRLGIENLRILSPQTSGLKKLVFFCPTESAPLVKEAIFEAGGGTIGNYESCSFEQEGTGAFTPTENAHPTTGKIGMPHHAMEKRVEILISSDSEQTIVAAMKKAHPYEEVAYELYPISNFNQDKGAGMIGTLKSPMETTAFLQKIKETFRCGTIRHTSIHKNQVKTIAFCGGAGSFLLADAIHQQADVYITADFKYHEFFDAEGKIIIADIGHYESEQFTPNLIYDILIKNFIKFAVYLSKVNTNPINYF